MALNMDINKLILEELSRDNSDKAISAISYNIGRFIHNIIQREIDNKQLLEAKVLAFYLELEAASVQLSMQDMNTEFWLKRFTERFDIKKVTNGKI